jgi:hypothetical protein
MPSPRASDAYIKDSKKGSLKYENTAFATDFHLYTNILNPEAEPEEYQLQPTKHTGTI